MDDQGQALGRFGVRALDAQGRSTDATLWVFDRAGRELTDLSDTASPGADVVLSTSSRDFGPLAPGTYELWIQPFGGPATTRKVTLAGSDLELDIPLD